MSSSRIEEQPLTAPGGAPQDDDDADLDQLEREIGLPPRARSESEDDYQDREDGLSGSDIHLRSQYALTRPQLVKALANRFVYSRTYILLYLAMAALSLTTVVLSLVEGCPGVAFYTLEIVINTGMITEVGIRFVAFGKKFWKSPYNYIDIFVTLFCLVTLIVLAVSGCNSTSSREELLDTLLLVARNVLQFTRLANVLRQSGRSIFAAPTPIDLSQARRAGFTLDIDLFDENAQLAETDPEAAAPLVRTDRAGRDRDRGRAKAKGAAGVVFDAEAAAANGNGVGNENGNGNGEQPGGRRLGMADHTKIQGTDDVEDQWASLG